MIKKYLYLGRGRKNPEDKLENVLYPKYVASGWPLMPGIQKFFPWIHLKLAAVQRSHDLTWEAK